jgi:hypothetical protein
MAGFTSACVRTAPPITLPIAVPARMALAIAASLATICSAASSTRSMSAARDHDHGAAVGQQVVAGYGAPACRRASPAPACPARPPGRARCARSGCAPTPETRRRSPRRRRAAARRPPRRPPAHLGAEGQQAAPAAGLDAAASARPRSRRPGRRVRSPCSPGDARWPGGGVPGPTFIVTARPAMRLSAAGAGAAQRQAGDGAGQAQLVEGIGDGAGIEPAQAQHMGVGHRGAHCGLKPEALMIGAQCTSWAASWRSTSAPGR